MKTKHFTGFLWIRPATRKLALNGVESLAADGLSCWPPPLSVSEESLNLLPAITPLKVCLFAYKTHS